MAFRLFGKKSQSETIITPTFFPLAWLQSYLSNGMTALDLKFLELYLTVPELQAIINYKARVFAGMRVKAVNAEGDEKEIPQLGLFNKPNPLQNFKEFSSQYYILRSIFGNSFQHPVYGIDKKNVQAIWNLPSINAKVIPVESKLIPFNMTKVEEIIKGYEFQFNSGTITYEPNEIIHFNDNQVVFNDDKFLLGDSKLRPLVQACENIKNAYDARGVLIQNSALGILTNEGTDGVGTLPLTDPDKKQLQADYNKYGLTTAKWQLIITNAALKWQSMATDVGKLKLYEEVDSDFRTIANAFAFPPEILQTDSTYENKEKAIRQLYQDSIIPEADEWLQGITNFMGLDGITFKSDFSHIAALQSDLEKRSRSMNFAATALSKARETGLIEEADAKEEFKKYLL